MPKILIIDDETAILKTLELFFQKKEYTVYTAPTARKGFDVFCEQRPDVVILDIRLPDESGLDVLTRMKDVDDGCKVIMITAFQDMETAIQAMKHGAYEYICKPLDIEEIEKAVGRALQSLTIEDDVPLLEEIKDPEKLEVIIGKSESMLEIFKMIGVLCQNRATVLVQGETGTGKELVARMVHRNSPYSREPFVTLDCSSVVETLIESELFGHEKGAFTGANRLSQGKIEAAGSGTLFLDEIGELPLNLQGKFLGFLQRREFMRVGGNQVIKARCRIIAATNRDLKEMSKQGTFKEDLYYRLKVITLHVPPLRDRLPDIPLLVNHFLQKINLDLGTDVSVLQDGVMDRLMLYPWTGNVRELENALVEAIVRARGKVLLLDDLEKVLATDDDLLQRGSSAYSLEEMEHRFIRKTLAEVGWSRTEAAKQLDISLPTLRKKILKYDIEFPESE